MFAKPQMKTGLGKPIVLYLSPNNLSFLDDQCEIEYFERKLTQFTTMSITFFQQKAAIGVSILCRNMGCLAFFFHVAFPAKILRKETTVTGKSDKKSFVFPATGRKAGEEQQNLEWENSSN